MTSLPRRTRLHADHAWGLMARAVACTQRLHCAADNAVVHLPNRSIRPELHAVKYDVEARHNPDRCQVTLLRPAKADVDVHFCVVHDSMGTQFKAKKNKNREA